ncbi:MAG: hypothetical protein H7Y43_04750, partial [Akkermansiaceae bacterium]|nr:hypothetical protein [Verrucomicrobiales bacterium]
MKLIATLLTTLLLTITAQARVFIYLQTYTQTYTGMGTTTATTFSGYLIMSEEGRTVQVDVSSKTKKFEIYDYQNYTVNFLRSGAQDKYADSILGFRRHRS